MMKNKTIKVKVQEFRPKNTKKFLKNIPDEKNKHPNLEDVKGMAEETIKDVPKYITDEKKKDKMIEDAKKTITDVEKEEQKRRGDK